MSNKTPRLVIDVNLVSYLISKGFKQVSHPTIQEGIVRFYFEDSDQISEEIKKFFDKNTQIDALTILEISRTLRSLISDLRRNVKWGGGQDE